MNLWTALLRYCQARKAGDRETAITIRRELDDHIDDEWTVGTWRDFKELGCSNEAVWLEDMRNEIIDGYGEEYALIVV